MLSSRTLLVALLILAPQFGARLSAQPSFLPSLLNTPEDNWLWDYAPLGNNRHVFLATRMNPAYSGSRWSDAIVFITNTQGAVIRQREFLHDGDSASYLPTSLFVTDTSIEIFGGDGFSVPNTDYPVCQVARWSKMDTMLNLLAERRCTLASGTQSLGPGKAVRMDGYTYALGYMMPEYWNPDYSHTQLLKFDASMNLVTNRRLDAAMFGTSVNVNYSIPLDISVYPPTRKLFLNAEIRISTSPDSFAYGGRPMLLKLDTALTLLDTFQYPLIAGNTGSGFDTSLLGFSIEILPLDEHRMWIGPVFSTTTPVPNSARWHVGLAQYSTVTRQMRHLPLAPNYNSTDVQSSGGAKKCVAQDGAGYVYALAASHSNGSPYFGLENALVLVKYDTNGNKLWHRFLNHNGGYFTPSLVYCNGDSMITILASRYDIVGAPTSYERDYYVVRLRASDGTPTAVFQVPSLHRTEAATVFPNPATTTLNIRLPKTATATSVTLYNTTGAAVRQTTFTGAETSISITDLPPGIYSYHINSVDKSRFTDSGLFLKK